MSFPIVELGEVVDFKGGGTPSRDKLDYWGGDIPWATVKDFNDGHVIRTTQEFITSEGLEQSASNLIPAGTVIIPTRMALGKAVVTEVDLAINQDLKAVFPSEKIDARYLLWYFIANASKIEAMGKGATVKGVTLEQLRKLKFPFVPLSDQRRIAALLDKASAICVKRREVILKLDLLVRTLFVDMFGDPLSNSKGWPIFKLEELVQFTGGSQPPKSVFVDSPRPGYVRLVQIRDFRTDKYPTYIPDDLARRRFEKTDVMIGRYGPPVFQIFRGMEGSYNVALMKAEPKEKLLPDYLFYMLKNHSVQRSVIASSQRSAGQTGVNLEFLHGIEVGTPPVNLQEKFASAVAALDAQREVYVRSERKANVLLNSLKYQMFAGKR